MGANCAQTPFGYNLFMTPAVEKIPALRRFKIQREVVKLVEKRGQQWQEEAPRTV